MVTRRRIGKKTHVKVDFASYSYLLNGIAGIGKTTMVTEIGKKLYGEDGVLLLTIGQEPLPDHLGNVLSERATSFDDLTEIINLLNTYKKEDYSDLKLIGIDTVDELFRLAEEKVLNDYNDSVDPDKRVATVGATHGGFQRGENKVVDLVISTLFSLRDNGYGLIFIGHTKKKSMKDLKTDIEYEIISSSLDSKYYNAIKDKVNLVGTAYVEREMNDINTVKDAFSKKNKKVGRLASEKRVVVFRDEEYAADVKSHFEFIEPKVEFTTDNFIKAVMDAIKKQSDKFEHKSTLKPETKKVENIDEEKEEDVDLFKDLSSVEEIPIVDEERNQELKTSIQKAMASAKDKDLAKKVKKVLEAYDAKNLDIKKPTKMFEEILKIFE